LAPHSERKVLADGLPPAMRQRIIAETRGRPPLSAISVMEQWLFLGERLLRYNEMPNTARELASSADPPLNPNWPSQSNRCRSPP
jgi:hypothetical protein